MTSKQLQLLEELTLACVDCGRSFTAIDPDRKYCDTHLVERVNGAGIFEDDEPDDLFDLIPQTCADCKQPFAASRRTPRCATCASLRTGQVGAATVVCPVCGIEHQVPILAPHKLCLSCAADPVLTLASARVRLERAEEDAGALSFLLDADVAHADEQTRARFATAVAMLATGQLAGRQLTTEQVKAAWEKACARADDLAPLLGLYDRAQAAALVQVQASAAVRAAEEALHG